MATDLHTGGSTPVTGRYWFRIYTDWRLIALYITSGQKLFVTVCENDSESYMT